MATLVAATCSRYTVCIIYFHTLVYLSIVSSYLIAECTDMGNLKMEWEFLYSIYLAQNRDH